MGYNHNFGHNREGNIDFIQSQSRDRFKVHLIKEQINSNKDSISSTRIRKYISRGKIEKANILLGRQYSLRGFVVKGQGIGRKINFPTINIKPLNNYQLIPFRGVYFVNLIIENQLYLGMCNIGFKPTLTNSKEESIEVHIFSVGIDRNFYKKEVEVFFVKYLRNERKFKNLDFLRRQLKKDKQNCLSIEI
jgi:riboflavin kinase/FMN adenylyltransferase